MNRHEATRKIRETQAALPISGFSAHAMNSNIDQAKQAGCNDYRTKLVDDDLRFARLDKYLG